jgi:hypothetical protein
MRFLGHLESLLRVFHRLPGLLVRAQVIAFSVLRGGGAVRVRSHLVKFSSSLVPIVCHGEVPPRCKFPVGASPLSKMFGGWYAFRVLCGDRRSPFAN